jgi:Ca-activated chloride channel family protein
MVDTSASTFKEFTFMREAAARFLRHVVRPVDRVAIYQFSDTVDELARFSSNVESLQASLALLETGSGTVMYDALVLGSQALERRPTGRRRVIVLVTDAGETTSLSKFEDARRAPLAAEAMLYTILIRPVKSESGRNTRGEHALITITDVTGGAMYTVDEESQMNDTFDRINRELRTQYRLGYYPNPRPPASAEAVFRRIEVRVSPAPGGEPFVVRHRQGYFASAP